MPVASSFSLAAESLEAPRRSVSLRRRLGVSQADGLTDVSCLMSIWSFTFGFIINTETSIGPHSCVYQSINQSINQSYFLTWPKQQTATPRTAEGKNS